MTTPTVSEDLTSWAKLAGYSLTPDDGSGAAIFWTDPGGMIKTFVRESSQGLFVVTSTERALSEQFEVSGTSMEVVERYLFGAFGADVRSRQNLPRLSVPRRAEALPAGFELSELDADGYRTLNDARGLVATSRGRVTSVSDLTELAVLLSHTIDEIKTSYTDPGGRPLFDVK